MRSRQAATRSQIFSPAARQNSLARHAFTAVVIKTTGQARYSAFCLFELTRNDDGTFSDWKMAAPWRSLPEGIRFDPQLAVSAPSLNFANAANNPGVPVTLPSVLFRGQSIDLNSATAFQVFAPDGTLTKGAPIRLRLLEGAEDSSSGIIYTGQQNGGQPANYYDIVLLRETGQAQSRALLISVAAMSSSPILLFSGDLRSPIFAYRRRWEHRG